MKKNPDEVLQNSDVPEQPIPTVEVENQNLRQENANLREQVDMVFDRLNRLEAVSSQNKLRKFDEQNNPGALLKQGRVPSLDGKDPFVSLTRTGKTWFDTDLGVTHDEQAMKIKTHGGVEKVFTLSEYNAMTSGNSIPAVVNDWEVYQEKVKKLVEKRHQFQRMNGKNSSFSSKDILNEIKEMEKAITLNVTLSEDLGKSFTGLTLDINEVVWNAVP
ncbi:MAG: hypothetical protein WC776_04895 [Patescibacteria group bacterium]|jgi:hypothetical protein